MCRRLFLPNRAPGMLVTENGRLMCSEVGRRLGEGERGTLTLCPTEFEIITTNHTVKSDKKAASLSL